MVVSLLAYAVSFAVAVLVVRAVAPGHSLVAIALGDVIATTVIFVISVLVNNSSIYDPYWSLQPAAIVGYYLWLVYPDVGARQILVGALVCLYAVRLTSNFYRDWPGLVEEDFRYADLRRRFGRLYWPVSFAGIHLFPTVMVYLGCLPLFAVAHPAAATVNWLDFIGALVMLLAVALAFIADEQLRVFRRDPVKRGMNIISGLWKRSRHPNYLGEVATWWGLYLFALAAGVRWWWTGVGALAITLMFVFISVPMMERRELATRTGYRVYLEHTPMLLPLGTTKQRAAREA